MPRIDPTARVADGARIADSVEIGPFCVVGPAVELKEGVRLVSHVSISGVTTLGERTTAYPFVSLGTAPQSTGYRGEPTALVIGSDCQFREGVTVSTGTVSGGGRTEVGDRCFMMANSHVGHDCHVGNDVIFANGAVIGGHAVLGNNVFLGGLCAVHQFNHVGDGVMIAGLSGVASDIIPFGFAQGAAPALLRGLNVVGLRRRGHSRDEIHRVRSAYRLLFLGTDPFAERLQAAETEFRGDPLVDRMIGFIRTKRPRPLMRAEPGSDDSGDS